MMPRFRRGVVTDLVVLIVATLLPLMLLSGYLARRNIDATRANASQNAIWQARETAARADALIGETQSLLVGLSQTTTIREGNPDQVRALLREVKTRYPYYDDLLALDGRGLVYVSAASLYGEAVGGTGPLHPREVPGAGQIATSEIQISRATGHPVVLIGVPVYASAGNHTVIGEVAAALDLLLLQQWLDNRALSPGTTITVVDNPGARVLARSDDPAAWVGRVVGDIPLVRTAIELDEGIVEGASFGDTTRHSAFTTARSVPWTVIVGIPNEAMDAPVRQELRLMALRIALTTLAVVTLAVVGSRRIVGPLRRLTGGTLMIARGDLDHRLAAERRDEVGQVASAVNQMADELIGSIAALQQAQGRLEGAVSQVGRALTSTADTPDLFARLVEAARALTRSDAAALVVASGAHPVVDGEPAPPPELLALLEGGNAVGLIDGLGSPARHRSRSGRWACASIWSRPCVRAARCWARCTSSGGDPTRSVPRTVASSVHSRTRRPSPSSRIACGKRPLEAAALRRLQELQSQFLTTAAHELRAPVTGIKSYAELLLRDDLDLAPATRRECLDGIDRLSDRLTAQVRIFFDAMRADSGAGAAPGIGRSGESGRGGGARFCARAAPRTRFDSKRFRSAAGPRRSRAGGGRADQPARQRDQVLARRWPDSRRTDHHSHRYDRRRFGGRRRNPRRRDRHRARGAAPDLRALLAPGPQHHAAGGRNRPRPLPLPHLCRDDGRHDRGGEPAGSGEHLPIHYPGRGGEPGARVGNHAGGVGAGDARVPGDPAVAAGG
ncbi:MAG: HAMP domain-containing protein [Thermomicrobiales bacterium]